MIKIALEKVCKTRFNIDATYWCVANVKTDKINKRAFIIVAGYPDEATRELSKIDPTIIPIDNKPFSIDSDLFDAYFSVEALRGEDNNQYKQAYLYLREKTEFIDATDILEDNITTP